MKRNLVRKHILMAGIVLPALTFLLGGTALAQRTSDSPPGMDERSGPFSGSHGPTTFGGKPDAYSPNKSFDSTFPGEIHGVARYPNGLPMPGANVLILSPGADVDRTMVSGSDGSFVFKNLKPGEYQVTATKDGFALSPVTKIELAFGKIATVDVPLGPSLAVSPMNTNLGGLMSASDRPAYRVQAASMRTESVRPEADQPPSAVNTTASESPKPSTAAADQPIPAAVADELDAMRRRIDELEVQLKARLTPDQPTGTPETIAGPQDAQAPATPKPGPGQYLSTAATPTYYKGDTDIPSHPDGWDPFSYADWTWMNANGRQHDSPWSTKYFTPEFRADVNYMDDFNHPKDNTMGGATESFRSNEWQLEQLSLGGDIRIGHVRGRILTMFGLFATTTPRNDASTARGQWDLRNAYRYISEGWGGYHFDVNHGLNVDAGIFVSYIGLFSYYNFDNWAYQPSYVSSNTPWFFNGLRHTVVSHGKAKDRTVDHQRLAILRPEPIVNLDWVARSPGGWPKPYLAFVFNNYGMGTDVLGAPGVSRIHTDDSIEVREYNKPDKFLDMMAMSKSPPMLDANTVVALVASTTMDTGN